MMQVRRRWFLGAIAIAFFVACSPSETEPVGKDVALTISVAASLQDAIATVGREYEQQFPKVKLVFNFGSSGALQHQIEQGAPVDIFISAATKQMDALRDKNLVLEETHQNLLQNQIVAIAPKESTKITDFQELTSDKVGKIALGDPESVPVGSYSQEVLESFNLYQKLANKFVFGKDVRQVLSYVETGNVDVGFVYGTDAKLCKNCREILIAPEDSHAPIVYPIAVLKSSKNIDTAREFVDFLSTDGAKSVFEKYGFIVNKK
ncbi:molybdate ABC transporter substrate-binding protein [Spirulina sp. 06S082]|uniref:molybdate ABC transporter substrate-binding protein n=1 Tax=Spirulina sp. 06S082 TaxID=3110248 RepID=UPI002B203C35|nr:molybdate ABC transporter substrate-binding protein [Spirulina sp. 06S082]MEA5470056.1 molybdate ABC transporter substrate-binding protein [Spirulina sp. 06S082]